MSREIKFRAWDKEASQMIYEGWNKVECFKNEVFYHISELFQIGSNVELLQFTGLTDKDGKEIYEGDIIEFDADEWGDNNNRWPVKWDNENGLWDLGGGASHKSEKQFRTVIGNNYQSPGLLNTESHEI